MHSENYNVVAIDKLYWHCPEASSVRLSTKGGNISLLLISFDFIYQCIAKLSSFLMESHLRKEKYMI
jgi:hypothetical protein